MFLSPRCSIIQQLFILSVWIYDVSFVYSAPQPCATLLSRDSLYQSDSLVLKAGSILSNIAEEYLTSEKSWNVTGVWTVNPSCELKACSGIYLTGECSTFSSQAASHSALWLSAYCQCGSTCQCPNHFHKSSTCARAYLWSGRCNICDSEYTELDEGTHDFPLGWSNNVTSVHVRSGCTITVYAEEEQEGESEDMSGPIVKEWNSAIGSYECECGDTDAASHPTPFTSAPTVPSGLQLVDIPNSIDDVVRKLAENKFNHPGLLASLSSLTHGRSSKNVYLLLIGSSGAGKSSAINVLLRNDNVTVAGDRHSTTSDILEFRFPMQIPELGVKNAELRVIDTPGLGDTRGIQNDAQFLATLDEYLTNHEELKTRIPNLVLIFHNFEDNRFDGEAARFVRMVRGLDTLREKMTDPTYSNVLFVFSHLCSVSPETKRNPFPRLMKFKEVVERYSLFPKPILTTVAENKGGENELAMVNGNFKLPNKELYPQNLLEKFDLITMQGKDKMGNAVVNSNLFRNRQSGITINTRNSTNIVHPLVSTTHNKVSKYLNVLTSVSFKVNNSEVSNLLFGAYSQMTPSIKSKYPLALENLQRYLSLKNVNSKHDVPQTSQAILELLSGIEQNEATMYLQEAGLKMKAPAFPVNTVTGYSYDILKQSILTVSPFKLDNLRASSLNFMLPTSINCTKSRPPKKPVNMYQLFDTKQVYYRHMINSLMGDKLGSLMNSTALFNTLVGKVFEGFVVKDNPCPGKSNMLCFTITRVYETFQLELSRPCSEVFLHSNFISRVQNIAPFNESRHESVEQWSTFFTDFGTHVVKSSRGGGRIDINFVVPKSDSCAVAIGKVLRLLDYADDPLGTLMSSKKSYNAILADSASVTHTLTFRGGNPVYHISDMTKLNLEKASQIMQDWKRSLTYYPAVFPKEIAPIGEVVGNHFPVSQQSAIKDKIQQALARLLTATLMYVAPTPDPKVLEELERQRKEKEELLKKLEEDQKKKEAEAARIKQKEEDDRKEREKEIRETAEKREKALQEEEEKRVREYNLMLQEQARLRRQQEEAKRIHDAFLQRLRDDELRREREHREAVRRQEEENERRRRRRSSCLKIGTRILLADFTTKPVELLKIGDVLLDGDLKPTKVLGVSYEFLLTQRFYGFDNKSFFFTDTHIFAGVNNDNVDTKTLQLYTRSTADLFAQNPLLEYLNIRKFGESTRLLYFDSKTQSQAVPREITIFQETKIYPMDTAIYFIQVDSPTGTYFAEGFLCRHEVPPFQFWLNTMPLLFSLFGTPGLEAVGEMTYSIESIHFIDKISDNVQMAVRQVLQREFSPDNIRANSVFGNANENCSMQLTLDNFEHDVVIGRIFGNPTMAALGMEIYGGAGSIISRYIDNPLVNLTDCRIQQLQMVLSDAIKNEIDIMVGSKNIAHNNFT